MELSRASEHARLEAYLEKHHPLLAKLLPPDTSCADLFSEVAGNGLISDFFDATDDKETLREFKRLTHMVQQWLIQEVARSKAQLKRERHDAQLQKRKDKVARTEQKKIFGTVRHRSLETAVSSQPASF